MYWPDYGPRKQKSSSWRGLGVLFVLLLSLFLAGEINGWWQIISPPGERPGAALEDSEEVTGPSVAILETAVPAAATPTPLPVAEPETAAPPFHLPDLFDDTVTVALSDYAGQPVILNFWASWCVPCRDEMPALERIYQQYQEQGLIVLGVNQLYIDELQTAQAFATELQLTFPNVADETGEVSQQRYRVVGLPTSVFITPNGEIAHVQVGQLTKEQIITYSQQLVAEEEIVP